MEILLVILLTTILTGLVIQRKSEGMTIIETVDKLAPEVIREKLRKMNVRRKHLKWLNRRVSWAANRLVNYPTGCKKRTKDNALSVMILALNLKGKFGLEKEIRDRAMSILDNFTAQFSPKTTNPLYCLASGLLVQQLPANKSRERFPELCEIPEPTSSSLELAEAA